MLYFSKFTASRLSTRQELRATLSIVLINSYTMSSHASLSAASNDRKARLAALKNLKRKAPVDEEESIPASSNASDTTAEPVSASEAALLKPNTEPEVEDIASRILSGRNYDPETKGPKLGFEAPPTSSLSRPTLEQAATAIETTVRTEALNAETDDTGVDLFKLQPKKPNWDLKRDLDKKLEVLNVRTENAIAQLVRERIDAAKKAKLKSNGDASDEVGIEGVALVEGLREMEREDEDANRREKEDEELA